MAAVPPIERLDRLEQLMRIFAEDQISLEKLIADLATETRRGFDQVTAQFRETDARLDKLARETDARFRETDARIDKLTREGAERSRALDERVDRLILAMDERVDRLVLAIGELIKRQDANRQ